MNFMCVELLCCTHNTNNVINKMRELFPKHTLKNYASINIYVL